MSDENTPRAGIPLIAEGGAQKFVTHDEAMLQFDALLCARFLDRDLTAPPSSPAEGDAYLIAAGATGAWTGHDGGIAFYADGAWKFYAPFVGLAAFVADESVMLIYTASGWNDWASLLDFNNIPLLGVNATADSTDKLAVKSSAVLFDNIGNGVQFKVNKNATADTASVLYQTGYSGRAEVGLCGDDDFHFKVSPDGSTFYNGLTLQAADGSVDLLAGETSIASAATVDLGTATSLKAAITGTTTITSFGSAANKLRFVRFTGALTLTHNATSLILLGGASRATAAGDAGIYASDASGNWRERSYFRAAKDPGDMVTGSGATLSGVTLSGATSLPGGGAITSAGSFCYGTATSAAPITIVDATAGAWFTGNSSSYSFFNILNQNNTSGNQGYRWSFDTNRLTFQQCDDSGGFSGNQMALWHSSGNIVMNQGLQIGVAIGNSEPTLLATLDVNGHIYPHVDNSYNLGSASYRFGTVYAHTGTINTSGAATKTGVRALSAAEIAVAKVLASDVRVFQFADAVAKKGQDAARLHTGMIFEDVVAAFAAQGLDPMGYGIVCRDRDEADPGKWILGLRYGELAQFVMAGLAARLASLEART